MKTNLILTIEREYKLLTHLKSDNIEIMMGSDTYEVIQELFQSLLIIYQLSLETSMKGSNFDFDSH